MACVFFPSQNGFTRHSGKERLAVTVGNRDISLAEHYPLTLYYLHRVDIHDKRTVYPHIFLLWSVTPGFAAPLTYIFT